MVCLDVNNIKPSNIVLKDESLGLSYISIKKKELPTIAYDVLFVCDKFNNFVKFRTQIKEDDGPCRINEYMLQRLIKSEFKYCYKIKPTFLSSILIKLNIIKIIK